MSILVALWPELKRLSLESEGFDGAGKVAKAINEKMALYQSDIKWYTLVAKAFETAGLPEFTKDELEAGDVYQP